MRVHAYLSASWYLTHAGRSAGYLIYITGQITFQEVSRFIQRVSFLSERVGSGLGHLEVFLAGLDFKRNTWSNLFPHALW